MTIVLLILGILQVLFGLITTPNNNLLAKLLFRVFPVISGMFTIIYALKDFGWILSI